MARVFTPNVVVEGWDDTWDGAEYAIARLREINASHRGSHRMVSGHRIDLKGDRARAVAYYRSTHLDEAPADAAKDGESGYGTTHAHEGWYVTEWRRAEDGWRMSRLPYRFAPSARFSCARL